jgi:hypothetical protein
VSGRVAHEKKHEKKHEKAGVAEMFMPGLCRYVLANPKKKPTDLSIRGLPRQ